MTDPYQVLGVSPNATDEQVKTAYRELARKYHPDNYADNPLADLATDKMKEINEAYDTIMAQRKDGQAASSFGQRTYQSGNSQFSDIRKLINTGRIAEAQELLDGVAVASRDAEWHFLKGSIYYSRGWLDEALASFQKAHQMNPQNQEYAAAYNQLAWQKQTGRPTYTQNPYAGSTSAGSSCDCCEVCAALYCCNCLCRGCSL